MTEPEPDPIPVSFVRAMRANFTKHMRLYIIIVLFWAQNSFVGIYDNFWPMDKEIMATLGWWQVLAAFLKSQAFAIGAALGYILHPAKTKDEKE